MKKLLLIIGMVGVLTTTKAQNATNVINTVVGYFTSFNTNLDDCFGATRATLWTGTSSIQGGETPLVNDVGISYDIFRPTPAQSNGTYTAISLESVTRTGGVAGTFVSESVGVGFSIIVHDARLTLYADGLYDFQAKQDRFNAEIGLRAFKALGHRFFAGAGLGIQVPRNSQVISAFAGFTF